MFTLAVAKGFAALGVAILLRAGLISIGHAMFYASAPMSWPSWPRRRDRALVILLFASALLSAAAGAVIGAFIVRYRAIFFAMLNLAVSMVFFTLLSKLYGITGGTDGMRVRRPRCSASPSSAPPSSPCCSTAASLCW